MSVRRNAPAHRRAETWLWTGPVGHLLGGALDFAGALARYLLMSRARGWRARARRARPSQARGQSVR